VFLTQLRSIGAQWPSAALSHQSTPPWLEEMLHSHFPAPALKVRVPGNDSLTLRSEVR